MWRKRLLGRETPGNTAGTWISAIVYLPVSVPDALLYVGDGHALQGDGELNGNALETSMEVEFTVDVLLGKRIPGSRVESATHIMAMGLGGSLDDAFRTATSNMAQWLTDEYKLTPSEVAQVLGTSAEYKVSEVADRNAGIVLKINKERLKSLANCEELKERERLSPIQKRQPAKSPRRRNAYNRNHRPPHSPMIRPLSLHGRLMPPRPHNGIIPCRIAIFDCGVRCELWNRGGSFSGLGRRPEIHLDKVASKTCHTPLSWPHSHGEAVDILWGISTHFDMPDRGTVIKGRFVVSKTVVQHEFVCD
jgi:Acetamidase/Formamidase family